jgi:D-beta-D-heptose 7-phosphate kinase/D-beta-D-heptose 1-phosphate adenosyltransferase
VRGLKGPQRPVQTEEDRAEILLGLKAVDAVVIFDEDTPLKLIESVKPDVLVKGGDWEESRIVGADFVKSYGGTVRSLPFHQGRSTTTIVNKIISST